MNNIFKQYEEKTRSIARDLIAEVEPENVDAVVESITQDMSVGASTALEIIQYHIDDSMGYYEIAEIIRDLKVKIDMTEMGFDFGS